MRASMSAVVKGKSALLVVFAHSGIECRRPVRRRVEGGAGAERYQGSTPHRGLNLKSRALRFDVRSKLFKLFLEITNLYRRARQLLHMVEATVCEVLHRGVRHLEA